MSVLVVLAHDGQTIHAHNIASLIAAAQLGEQVDALLLAESVETLLPSCQKLPLIQRIIAVEHDGFAHGNAEYWAQAIAGYAKSYRAVVMPSGTMAKNILPRVAGLTGVAMWSDVLSIVDADTVTRPVYAGNAIATLRSVDALKILSVRPSAFRDQTVLSTGQRIIVDQEAIQIALDRSASWLSLQAPAQDRLDVTTASIVVSGGRGVGSAENFEKIFAFAERIGAAVGASRAAVDAGFVANDLQVGQTGKIIAPDVYIALGISGAVQHLAGMKDSGIIIAVNTDAEAPIFQVADYGWVGDLFEALPHLERAFQAKS